MGGDQQPRRLDPDEAAKPGREKSRTYGGDGTPRVTEFAAAALGARIGLTTYAAGQLIADALDLVHRSTALWVRVEAGEVSASYARFVVSKTRSLPEDEAQFVATAVAESADGRVPWSRFEALVEAAVTAADPAGRPGEGGAARQATFARKLRDQEAGMGSYLVRAPIPVIDLIAATVDAYSAAINEDFPDLTDDQRDRPGGPDAAHPRRRPRPHRARRPRPRGQPLRTHLPRRRLHRNGTAGGSRPGHRGLGP